MAEQMTDTQKRRRGRGRAPIPLGRRVHHVVVTLDRRTAELGMPSIQVAPLLGVAPTTLSSWRTGTHSPPYLETCTWADLVGLRLAVVLGAEVLAEGPEVVARLRELRQKLGLPTAEVAARRRIAPTKVTHLERTATTIPPQLITIDAQITALGLRLTVLNGRDKREAS
ncbi:hypothetical protein Aph01nite_43270 [Acrocarpospora phusangensis]|uniref:Uncharacterized protein n=1 Tax=Acrocarpospora phusangensis TaxID=1070424 RepID=A0A919QBS9_9ACTN|nr:hypothetical protein [Acrocarpospora phusangensis]GIH26017.1 hypothetical protein Aph01nite_43270 [Acrocarpospora phusangensis]